MELVLKQRMFPTVLFVCVQKISAVFCVKMMIDFVNLIRVETTVRFSAEERKMNVEFFSLGTCKTITNVTFSCHCSSNWTGNRCEMRINFCDSSPCLNNGVCRSLVGGYRCECLTSFYSGRHCENDSNGIQIREILAKSFAYVAIIFICGVVMFFVMMDVLKYFFDIDPVKTSKPMQKPKPRRKKFIIISKFSYMPGHWDS